MRTLLLLGAFMGAALYWQFRRFTRWPHPEDFDRMTSGEIDAYMRRMGFEDRVTKALAEVRYPDEGDDGVQPVDPWIEALGDSAFRQALHEGLRAAAEGRTRPFIRGDWPRCNCPESGTSGACPFHDAYTA